MDALVGPTPVARNGQVSIPKHIVETLGWNPGEMVMLRLSDDDPEVLTVVPLAVCLRRYRRGEEAEQLMRLTNMRSEPAGNEAINTDGSTVDP